MEMIDKMTPESGWIGKLTDKLTPEAWKTTQLGNDYEGNAKRATEQKEAENALDEQRKKRNALFQTQGGSSGEAVLNVGARDTYFGN